MSNAHETTTQAYFRKDFQNLLEVKICYQLNEDKLSLMRKPAFCLCEKKDADQLCGNREADQCLCFHYTDSTIPLLPKSEISSLQPSSVAVQPGLCQTWSETRKTGFLITKINYHFHIVYKGTHSNNNAKRKIISQKQ